MTGSGSAFEQRAAEFAALHGKKSKIGEVLCEVQMVECLACNEGAGDLCAQDEQREQTTQRYEKRSRCVPGEFCFSLSREELEETFGSYKIGKENHV